MWICLLSIFSVIYMIWFTTPLVQALLICKTDFHHLALVSRSMVNDISAVFKDKPAVQVAREYYLVAEKTDQGSVTQWSKLLDEMAGKLMQPESIYNTTRITSLLSVSVLSGTRYGPVMMGMVVGGVNGWDLKRKGISSSRETMIQETGRELKGREPLMVGMAQRLIWCIETMGQRQVFEEF